MANLGEKSEISGSVLLSWHEKVRLIQYHIRVHADWLIHVLNS